MGKFKKLVGIGVMIAGLSVSGTALADTSEKAVFLGDDGNVQSEDIGASGAGTLVHFVTNAQLTGGKVSAYGKTSCSKTCKDLRVSNIIYRSNKPVSTKTGMKTNNISVMAYADPVAYKTGYTYYSASDHFAVNYYGKGVSDRTIDDDL
ncbi:hypothetical protein [Priestia megaterium]|uniref:hypothetical protein n=1 Tax=Priestia megaterium TaxID=1404 RepID=UPI003672DC7B